MFFTKIVPIFLLYTVPYSIGVRIHERLIEDLINRINHDELAPNKGKNEIMNTLDKYIRYKVLDRNDYSRENLNRVLVKRIIPHQDSSPDIQYDYDHNIIYKPLVTIHKRIPVKDFNGLINEGSFENGKDTLFNLIMNAANKNPNKERKLGNKRMKYSKKPLRKFKKYNNRQLLELIAKKIQKNQNKLHKRTLRNKQIRMRSRSKPRSWTDIKKSKYKKRLQQKRSNSRYVNKNKQIHSQLLGPKKLAHKKLLSKTPEEELIKNLDSIIQRTNYVERRKIYSKILNMLGQTDKTKLRMHVPDFHYDSDNDKPKKWLPEYGYWNYWTYDQTIHQDDCPGNTVRLGDVCIDTLHH